MSQALVSAPDQYEDSDFSSVTHAAHILLRFVLAIRYRKNLFITIMVTAALLGGLYYATTPDRYASKAVILVTQIGPDHLDTSITNEESQRKNVMPTFENMILSSKVLESALKDLTPADRVDLDDTPRESWAAGLKEILKVQTIRFTSIMEVSYRSKSPQAAANVVRAVVQSYLNFMADIRKGTAGDISRILTREREEVADKLSRKQQELLDCRRHFADLGFRSDGTAMHPMVQRAVYFNDALVAAQKERVQHEAMLATIQTAILNDEDLSQYVLSVGDAVGRELLLSGLGLSNRDINSQAVLEQSLISSRADLQTAQQNLGPLHPEVVALVEKIRLIEQFLDDSKQRIGQRMTGVHKNQLGPWLVQSVRQKLDESKKKESILQTRFEESRAEAVNLNGQLAQIELLERDVKRMDAMNDVLLNQIASLDLKQNGQDVRVAVIEEPTVPASPVSPRLSFVAVLTALCGFSVALALVTLLDAMDDRFRSVEEMQHRLGLPLLTMIQRLQPREAVGVQALVTHAMPTAPESEGFRTLRTALTLTYPDAHQIVATSTEPGDGKTTTVANLAVCYAQADKRTLLIDADLRCPGLTSLMNLRGPRGLSEILRAEVDVVEMAPLHIRASGIKGLDVLPSGSRPPDPAELLGSPRLSQLLAWAETVYDLILIDSPPTLATTDTAIIGRLVDGAILVVQPAKNHRRLVVRAVERLGLMKIPILGMVINQTGSGDEYGYYGYQSYEYGFNEEFSRDHSAATPDDEMSEACLPLRGGPERGNGNEEEPRTLIVPRRVA